jgi:hypothetical protein
MWSRFIPSDPEAKPTRKELGLKRNEKCKWVFSNHPIECDHGFLSRSKKDTIGVDGTVYHPDQEPMPIFLHFTASERREFFAFMKRIQKRIQLSTWVYSEEEDY